MMLLPLGKPEVFLCVFDHFRLERGLNVVFLLQELLAFDEDFILHLGVHLVVEGRGLVQFTPALLLLCLQLALLRIRDRLLLQLLLQVILLGLLDVNVEVHLGKLVRLILKRVARLVKVIVQSLLQAKSTRSGKDHLIDVSVGRSFIAVSISIVCD